LLNLTWPNVNGTNLQHRNCRYAIVSEIAYKILNGGIQKLNSKKVFREFSVSQEQIKQMCIEYVKIYFGPSDTKALSKYFEENTHKLKFYIDDRGNPNFRDKLRN
jgi:hypothetical protein